MSVVAAICLVGAAAAGAARVRGLRPTVIGPLAVLTGAGFTWALLTALPDARGMVVAIESLPGGGLLRDSQKWLAPWLILLALAAGSGLARMANALRGRSRRGPEVVLAILIPVLLLPDLAFGMWGRLQPVHYPAEWESVRTHLAESEEAGDVVSWPWSTFRAYEWNDSRTSLDPAPRYLPRTVAADSRLLVRQDDQVVIVASDDARSIEVGEALLQPGAADRLSALGIGWFLIQEGQPAGPGYPVALPSELEAASTSVIRSGTLELRRLSSPAAAAHPFDARAVVGAWVAWIVALVVTVVALVRHLWPTRHRGTRAGRGAPDSLRRTDGR